MYASDLFRADTLVLLLLEGEAKPVGAGEIRDALEQLGIDMRTDNIARELKSMQQRALITCAGWGLRYGRHRMRVYKLTPTGRAVVAQRRTLLEKTLYEAPAISGAGIEQQAEGWHA